MDTPVSRLLDRIADALEARPCRDFEDIVDRVLPLAHADAQAVIVDVESDADPPCIIIATVGSWLIQVDCTGIRAGKVDPAGLAYRDRPTPAAAVQRKFARPLLRTGGPTARKATH